MYVTLHSSTCFEQHAAHHQEDQFITTASGIVTLCKQLYSMRVESGLTSPLSTRVLYGCLQRVTIPDAVVIKLVLLMMSSVLLETC